METVSGDGIETSEEEGETIDDPYRCQSHPRHKEVSVLASSWTTGVKRYRC